MHEQCSGKYSYGTITEIREGEISVRDHKKRAEFKNWKWGSVENHDAVKHDGWVELVKPAGERLDPGPIWVPQVGDQVEFEVDGHGSYPRWNYK